MAEGVPPKEASTRLIVFQVTASLSVVYAETCMHFQLMLDAITMQPSLQETYHTENGVLVENRSKAEGLREDCRNSCMKIVANDCIRS